jgi:hypothetical protein
MFQAAVAEAAAAAGLDGPGDTPELPGAAALTSR